jgi:hypothetical protein
MTIKFHKINRNWQGQRLVRRLLDNIKKTTLIRSIGVRRPIQKVNVFVEIIPREIVDVVSKPFKYIPHTCRPINDTSGYKSLNDAIVNAQNVGLGLLGKVKPENHLFIFGETVQSLQAGLRKVCDRLLVSYPADDCYGPIYDEQDARANEGYGEPCAVVLCKILDAEPLRQLVGRKQKKCRDYAERYEITWSELQALQKSLSVVAHGGLLSSNIIIMPHRVHDVEHGWLL